MGAKNYECEMNLYCAETDIANSSKTQRSEVHFYDAGTHLGKIEKVEKVEMDFYAAAILGGRISGDKLEKNIGTGLRKRLLSYADVKVVNGAFKFWLNPGLKDKKLFLDSGAFSALTRGIKINIDEYIEYIKTNKPELTVYAGLDVIGDWQGTKKNVEYMESKGLWPLPAFHYQSPTKELERMCKKYDYIALGGLVPLSRRKPTMRAWLDSCWVVIKKHFPIKIHAFGITTQWALERYPFYSCDSSAAIMGGGMGRLMIFDGKKLNHSDWKTKAVSGKNMNCADRFNVDGSAHLERRIHNIKEMIKFEKHITDLWTKRGIAWND